jgi:phage tail sheath protein FI
VVSDRDREDFARATVNLVRRAPIGFVATDAMTLSSEHDWGEINVRRLMSLLRRVCVRRGAPFVFEPNGDTTRRAIERTFGHMLDDMVRRGAFAGKGKADSYRLSVDASESDRMNGRLVIEIAVAPAQPLRFLTLVLAQAGERFTVAEER